MEKTAAELEQERLAAEQASNDSNTNINDSSTAQDLENKEVIVDDKNNETIVDDKPIILDPNATSEDFDKVLEAEKAAALKKDQENKPPEIPKNEPIPGADNDKSTTLESNKIETDSNVSGVKITDEYIKSQPEELKEILSGIRNETLTPKALQNYIEAEKIVYETKAKEPQIVELKDIAIPDNQKAVVNAWAFERLCNKYPALKEKVLELKERGVDNPDTALQEYTRDLNVDNPESAYDFINEKRSVLAKTEDDLRQSIYIKTNEGVFAKQAIDKAKGIYVEQLKKLGITDPERLLKEENLDFTILKNGSNEVLKNILHAQTNLPSAIRKFGGNGNPNDLNDTSASYLFDPEVIALRAFALISEPIFKRHSLEISKASFEKGFTRKEEKKNEIPPSHSNGSGLGKVLNDKNIKITPKVDPNDFQSDDDKILKEIRDSVLSKSK